MLCRLSDFTRNVSFYKVMAPALFAYRESHQPCYSDSELAPSTAQCYKVVKKSNLLKSVTESKMLQHSDM